MTPRAATADPLAAFHAPTRDWFEGAFEAPTAAQVRGWPPIAAGRSTLLLAPTGSGKTLAAFLAALDRLMFGDAPAEPGVRVLYVSPLKALGVDVERNLRAPLAGLAAAASRAGVACRTPSVGVRSGDTPADERRRLVRRPPEILITTPESLYLLLTSQASETLRHVETVIVDEIHAVAGTKRGVHLFLSLERLEHLRDDPRPLQRIGLSATQRPLDEIARLLGGGAGQRAEGAPFAPRAVEIVDAGRLRAIDVTIEVPVEDMAQLGDVVARDPGTSGPQRASIWPAIHPRLVELIRAHRTTIVFTNSRRLSERLAGAINDCAGEELARAHHGSVAKHLRLEIEEQLGRGRLRAIVATSSLELGIDMGAVDLVIQIEAPVSVTSGLQRVGRAGHSVDAVSKGVVFPKHRHDLLVAAAATRAMLAGRVEETRYPRNALDVLAQQVVGIVVQAPGSAADAVFDLVRRAAPYADLPRASFDGVLDLLSGRYPSERFGELRARVTWDRVAGTLTPRRGARRVAVLNPGTIPDRGLYGVFLAGADEPVRVGELDEEMVHETLAGEVFLLGASAWRVEEITHDRVLVSPAPGAMGRMPFWKGDRPGRPVELGAEVGRLTARLGRGDVAAAEELLREESGLDERAARNLVAYVRDQKEHAGALPTDDTLVVERFLDEVGDWCVCVHSPFGGRVHAPWATAVQDRLRAETGVDAQALWTDDGIVFRLPETDAAPDAERFLPASADVEALVTRRLADTSLFASRFRENAGRALLLPRRSATRRNPLWAQRRRAADLLQVASDFPDFPLLLETYRECLKDVFDMPALRDLLRRVEDGRVRVRVADTARPSPFAASMLFSYVGSFIYEDDRPLAERRAAALALDHAQLRALLGEPELRELLDEGAIAAEERRLQRLDGTRPIRHDDALHDALLALGPLSLDEVRERTDTPDEVEAWSSALIAARRVVEVRIGGDPRLAAAEDAARLRDALGVELPPGLPDAFLERASAPLDDVLLRHARTHGPFRAGEAAARFGLDTAAARAALVHLAARDLVAEGEFLPHGRGVEWCAVDVLRRIKQRSLARLRKEVEPVEHAAFARFAADWHAVDRPLQGLDGLLAVVERLQGLALPASDLETRILPARLAGFDPRDLDALCSAGEIVWRGAGALGTRDGRVALYLADHFAVLATTPEPAAGELPAQVRALLRDRGALFFADLLAATGAFKPALIDALHDLVWAGEVTNDTLAPLRSLRRGERRRRQVAGGRSFRSRRDPAPPGTEGRWSLLPDPAESPASPTDRAAARAAQLLERHGVVCRETIRAEDVAGGFSAVYPVLRAMEEAGRVRRGYFVEGLGAAQFAVPGADDRLRRHREPPADAAAAVVLAATDPAQPYGATLPWPATPDDVRPRRDAGALCVLHGGRLLGHVSRTGRSLTTFLAAEGPERDRARSALLDAVVALSLRDGMSLARIDGRDAQGSSLRGALLARGFRVTSRGLVRARG